MSGAGKSTALKMMEDIGYYCVDNLPIPLFEKFVDLINIGDSEIQKVAIGIDIRSGQSLSTLENILEKIREDSKKIEVLFLDASDTVLVKRYKETRRSHPLAQEERVDKGIEKEREKIAFLRKQADYILDTSSMLTRELKIELNQIFKDNKDYKNLFVNVVSFGYKYGIPADADLVFDVRFLKNPYYIPELRPKTGLDEPVHSYVMNEKTSQNFLVKIVDLLKFLIPNYIAEGKTNLVIAVGCTGGKHRSVTLAEEIYEKLKENKEYGIKIEHRDIGRDQLR